VGTLVRDAFFKAIFFTTNDLFMKAFHGDSPVANPTYAFIAGGLTGVVSWMAIFPLDSLKSIQQTESLDQKKYLSLIHI
jgi:solute carrier family 25 carnitine/acylcarnitine transporter 20/29